VATKEGQLKFDIGWSSKRLDEWLWENLPKPFAYLNSKYGDPGDDMHWLLLKIKRVKLERQSEKSCGYNFANTKGSANKAWYEYKTMIGEL
jgi:hypothetical protein